METSQPLATESFSYSWLTNKRPDFYSFDDQETISMVFDSKRFFGEAHNFNFDIPSNKSSIPPLVDDDEIFSAGQIMPLYSVPATAVSFKEELASSFPPDRKKCSCLLAKWRKSSKRLLQKCFRIFRPSKKSIRIAADIDRKGVGDDKDELLQSTSNSSDVPRDFDNSSISEAVLHCKRSISMLS